MAASNVQPAGLGNLQPDICKLIIEHLPDSKDRKRLRNKHLKEMVDELVEEVKGCVSEALWLLKRYDYCPENLYGAAAITEIATLLNANWKNLNKLILIGGDDHTKSQAGLNNFFAAHQKFRQLQSLELRDFVFERSFWPQGWPAEGWPVLEALQDDDDVFRNLKELALDSYDRDDSMLLKNFGDLKTHDVFLRQLSKTRFVRRLQKFSYHAAYHPSLRDILVACKSLEALKLHTVGFNDFDNTGRMFSAFAESGCFQNLRELVLDSMYIDEHALKALALAEFPALTRLVFNEQIGLINLSEYFASWSNAQWVPKLKELSFDIAYRFLFYMDELTEPFMKLCKLQWLELETFIVKDHEYEELAEVGEDPYQIESRGMVAFVNAADHFPKLQTVDIYGWYNAEALAGLCNFPCLTSLCLFMRSIEDLRSFTGKFPKLKRLYADTMGKLADDDVKSWVMSQAGNMPALEELCGDIGYYCRRFNINSNDIRTTTKNLSEAVAMLRGNTESRAI